MLAIIIPYYKLTFFEATLQSLANQKDKRFKVYIGDDESPEDCLGLLQKFEGQFDFVYNRFISNLGSISLTKQWERCIALSEDEDWIMILGDDDILGMQCVASFYENLNDIISTKSSLVRFASIVIDRKGNEISEVFFHPKLENVSDFYYRKIKNRTRSSLSEYVFNKSIYEKKKFVDYPMGWHSDDRAWFDFSNNNLVFTINNSVVFIRISENSISGKNDNIEKKEEATILFYKDLITKKEYRFNSVLRLAILLELELVFKKKGKPELSTWLFLLKHYLVFCSLLEVIKLLRRYFINTIK